MKKWEHNGAEIHFEELKDGCYHIDRIFVPENLRMQGRARVAMEHLIAYADSRGIVLSANVMPDDGRDESYEKLRKFLQMFDFKPIRYDGQEYRNDLNRKPKEMSVTGSIMKALGGKVQEIADKQAPKEREPVLREKKEPEEKTEMKIMVPGRYLPEED